MSDGSGALNVAAAAVSEALRGHADICQREPENVAGVVRAGEILREAVLEYERVLHACSGWSNPIRHLGRLPIFSERPDAGDPPSLSELDGIPQSRGVARRTGDAPKTAQLVARYLLRINNEDSLLAFAGGRFGEEVGSVEAAIQVLYEADSWDPRAYQAGLIDVGSAAVEISVDDGDHS